ncbi:hypothetical protein [Coleofasciculus sp. B1-GNL1-01]|uniref:hypothetical protein n=1 Tax=Coleofasciculus sp. B1-GNL1-01 TaxID=3068484 RepID=UPI0040648C5D
MSTTMKMAQTPWYRALQLGAIQSNHQSEHDMTATVQILYETISPLQQKETTGTSQLS